MELTRYTDFSLRILTYLALQKETLVTIGQVSSAYGISRNHVVKVVHHLGKIGYIETFRGKQGGIRLGYAPSEITVGQVVRDMEENLTIVECNKPPCPIRSVCTINQILNEAQQNFLKTLDHYTLEDLVRRKKSVLGQLLEIPVFIK